MRKLLIAALLALPLAAVGGNPQTVVLDVQNMTCTVCPITVRKALEKVAGVMEAKVDFDKKTATVHFDPDKGRYPCARQSNDGRRLSLNGTQVEL
jgi:mercuric ion binding protein